MKTTQPNKAAIRIREFLTYHKAHGSYLKTPELTYGLRITRARRIKDTVQVYQLHSGTWHTLQKEDRIYAGTDILSFTE